MKQTHVNVSSQRIVESLRKLNGGRLSRTGWSNDGDKRAGLDSEGKLTEDTDTRASRVAEVDAFEANASDNIFRDETLGRAGVNVGFRIQELDDADRGTTSGRDIRDEREDVSSLDGTKSDALIEYDLVKGLIFCRDRFAHHQ